MPGASGHIQFDKKDEELKWLRRLVRDLELEARGRRRRRDRDDREEGSASGGGRYEAGSNQFGSRRHRDRSRSRDYVDQDSDSPEERWPRNAAMDAISCTLCKAAQSSFSDDIERAPMLSIFTYSPFNS